MMRALRDKRFMKFVLWSIIIVFIGGIFFMWGVKEAGMGEDTRDLAAKVGNRSVSYNDFNRLYQAMIQNIFSGRAENPSEQETQRIRDKVLDRLIEEAILEQTADDLGVRVANDELVGALQRQPYFLGKDGKFDKNQYLQILQANNTTPQAFEEEQRRDMRLQKTRSILSDSVIYSDQELDRYAALLARHLKVSLVALDTEAFEKKIKVTESEIKDYFENYHSRYDRPERAKVRHILLSVSAAANQQDKDRAKSALEDYRKQVVSGKAKFSELAKKYSQDQGSKEKGGDLGWITRDNLPREMRDFENAVFALKKGELTKPILTSFGYHLAELEDHERAHTSKLSEIREKLLKDYRKEKASENIFVLAQQLTEKLERKETLEKAASALGLEVSKTPWFTRKEGIPGLKDSKETSDLLADLQIQDWRGPIAVGTKQCFFQITEARESELKNPLKGESVPEMAQRLLGRRQEIWLEDFIKSQRKKLGVKIYQTS